MKNFDLQRFGRVLRFDFAQNHQQLLWCVLGMLMVYLFFFWFAHNIGMRRVSASLVLFVSTSI